MQYFGGVHGKGQFQMIDEPLELLLRVFDQVFITRRNVCRGLQLFHDLHGISPACGCAQKRIRVPQHFGGADEHCRFSPRIFSSQHRLNNRPRIAQQPNKLRVWERTPDFAGAYYIIGIFYDEALAARMRSPETIQMLKSLRIELNFLRGLLRPAWQPECLLPKFSVGSGILLFRNFRFPLVLRNQISSGTTPECARQHLGTRARGSHNENMVIAHLRFASVSVNPRSGRPGVYSRTTLMYRYKMAVGS